MFTAEHAITNPTIVIGTIKAIAIMAYAPNRVRPGVRDGKNRERGDPCFPCVLVHFLFLHLGRGHHLIEPMTG